MLLSKEREYVYPSFSFPAGKFGCTHLTSKTFRKTNHYVISPYIQIMTNVSS